MIRRAQSEMGLKGKQIIFMLLSTFIFYTILRCMDMLENNYEKNKKDYQEHKPIMNNAVNLVNVTNPMKDNVVNLANLIEPAMFGRDVFPSDLTHIFLLETSQSTAPLYLNYRVLCSLQSWCNQNPEAEIWYLVRSSQIADEDHMIKGLTEQYSNLRLAKFDADEVLAETPLLQIIKLTEKSQWANSHMSDLLRLALLWKYGGWYTDSDTVCLRTVKSFSNILSLGSKNTINSAVMHMDKEHPFIWRNMEVLSENYKPGYYVTAVQSIQEEIWRACNVSLKTLDTLPQASPNPCPGFEVISSNIFFPYDWTSTWRLFIPDSLNIPFDVLFRSSYGFHLANGRTFARAVVIGGNTIYEEAFKKYCPYVYKNLPPRGVAI